MRFIIFIILGATSIVQAERMVQTYNGALMKITCATATPSFLINGIYSSRHYNQLPGLYSIEARVAPDRSNVTLHVNGSIQAHNITVKCQNLVDPVTGQTETMFQLTLLFNDTIPAPHDVQYDEKNGILSWRPPQLEEVVTDDSINIALRITHYIIHVTDLQSEFSTSFTTTGPETSIAIADILPSMPCSVSLQVSAVNPEQEGQRSTSIMADRCSVGQGVVTTPKDSRTPDITESEEEISAVKIALSDGGIAAVAITVMFVALIVVSVTLLMVCYFIKHRKVSKSSKSEEINEENPGEISKPRSASETSDSSQTELLTPNNNSPPSTPKQYTVTQHQSQCLYFQETGNNKTEKTFAQGGPLIYAELAPSVLNPISQPSSVDNTTYATINLTNQTN